MLKQNSQEIISRNYVNPNARSKSIRKKVHLRSLKNARLKDFKQDIFKNAQLVFKCNNFKVYSTKFVEYDDSVTDKCVEIPRTQYMVDITNEKYLRKLNAHCADCFIHKLQEVLPNALNSLLGGEPNFHNLERYVDLSLNQTKPIASVHADD